MIDICDFAVGLSRQLYGLTIATERPDHRMMETWHPLGVGRRHLRVQFPGRGLGLECLRWPWSAAIRVVWKPSEKTPLTRARRARRCSRAPSRGSATRPDGLCARSSRAAREVGEALVDRSARAAGLGDRLDADGPRGRRRGSRRGSAARCSSSAATTR